MLAALAIAPVLAGLALVGGSTPRWAGIVLLAAFTVGLACVVIASRVRSAA